MYPTVGLQTPGEIVDANFGQQPFIFDIEDMLKELRESTKASILRFPQADDQGDWTIILNKCVHINNNSSLSTEFAHFFLTRCLSFSLSLQNGFILFSSSWIQFDRRIICKSNRTKSKRRYVFNKNASK